MEYAIELINSNKIFRKYLNLLLPDTIIPIKVNHKDASAKVVSFNYSLLYINYNNRIEILLLNYKNIFNSYASGSLITFDIKDWIISNPEVINRNIYCNFISNTINISIYCANKLYENINSITYKQYNTNAKVINFSDSDTLTININFVLHTIFEDIKRTSISIFKNITLKAQCDNSVFYAACNIKLDEDNNYIINKITYEKCDEYPIIIVFDVDQYIKSFKDQIIEINKLTNLILFDASKIVSEYL